MRTESSLNLLRRLKTEDEFKEYSRIENKKHDLEYAIRDMVLKFQKKMGIDVSAISIQRTHWGMEYGDRPPIMFLNITLDHPRYKNNGNDSP